MFAIYSVLNGIRSTLPERTFSTFNDAEAYIEATSHFLKDNEYFVIHNERTDTWKKYQ